MKTTDGPSALQKQAAQQKQGKPHPQSSPQAALAAAKETEKPKSPKTYRCFMCGEDHETQKNSVGHISFNDGSIKRNIFVCHYCAATSLQDLFEKAPPEKLQMILGELMYQRALDSRAW